MDCDDEEDENLYIVRGTPLPELDEDAILNRKAAQDLTVRDEKGRQRFHGAFTGGFSAGYFNTVGTKEGWEPSNFVSSRASKAASSNFHQKPEDFMDDEDFGEFGIAPKRIRTTADFSDKNVEFEKRHKRNRDHDFGSIIPGEPPLKELVKPVMESIGVAILRKLGWRPGQGIGARVKKKESFKVVGCSLGPLAADKPDPFLECFISAPDDTPETPYKPKDDLHGIGYSGLSTQSILSAPLLSSATSTKSWLAKDRKKLSISGQAFGIGALEDDDDGDVYSKEDMSQYDFSEFLGEKTQKSTNEDRKGRLGPSSVPLQGFLPAKHPPVRKKFYPLPDLPANFVPLHKSKPSMQAQTSVASEISKHKMNHALRSVLLGEKPNIKPVQQAETPIERTSSRRSRFDQVPATPTNTKPLPAPQLITPPLTIPPLMSLKFKPFAKDPFKQKRYEDFLTHNCDPGFLKSIQPSDLTEWEKQLELDEFAKTASFYQPLSKELDSRFESRSHLDVETTSGIIQKSDLPKERLSEVKKNVPVREVFEWHPASLLCKRFNVPNPYPDSKIDGVPGIEKKKPSLFDCLSFSQDSSSSHSIVKEGNSNDPIPAIEKDVPNVVPVTNESGTLEIEATKISSEPEAIKTKPPMDLFKEIFQTSSSENDESSDEDSKHEVQVESTVTDTAPSLTPPVKVGVVKVTPKTSNSSDSNQSKPARVAFGVFANLDLDALNKRTVAKADGPALSAETKQSTEVSCDVYATTTRNDVESSTTYSNCYGPDLPPQGVTPVSTTELIHKEYKHKHKHHKYKEKKSKKKKKHKHQKRKKESSSSSSEYEEQVLDVKIVEKLKNLHKEKSKK